MVNMAEVPLADAVKMITATPAKVFNIKNKGFLKEGYDADIAIFDKDINIYRTIIKGKTVFEG